MAGMALKSSIIVILFGLAVALSPAAPGQAQSALEEWAKAQISEKTGIDEDLLATLFVTDGDDQFILAFVYINEEVMQSNLKPDLKGAIAPFVGQKALLTLVVPTRRSAFRPMDISFSQDGMVHLIDETRIHPVTDDFLAGQLPAQKVSAGVIELPQSVDIGRPFQISYRNSFSTTFSIGGEEVPSPGRSGDLLSGVFRFLFQFLLFFFLIPFLVGI